MAALALCAGCTTMVTGQLENVDKLQQPLLGDLRLPAGARIDNSQSLILGGGAHWSGRAVFVLTQAPSDVFAYMRDQLSAAGWVGVSSVKAKTSILVYTSQDRTLTVEIAETGTLSGGSQLTLTAAPKGSFWSAPAQTPVPAVRPATPGAAR